MCLENCRFWHAFVATCVIVGGCQKPNTILSTANYLQKFDEVEDANRAHPGDLTPTAVEAILGAGEAISAGDPDLASAPPGLMTVTMKWSRWAFQNEVLLVGYSDSRVATVVRLRR